MRCLRRLRRLRLHITGQNLRRYTGQHDCRCPAQIPETPAALFAVSTALAAHATEGNFDRVLTYNDRLINAGHREFGALLARDAVRRTPTLQNTHAFIRAQAGPLGEIIRG